jgi:DNA-binding IclR family transcriptional regulator
VSALVRPILQKIVIRFGETAFVARLNGDEVHSVAVVVPENYSQSHVHPGRSMPINAAASAKAIFAFQPDAVISKALSQPLKRYTSNTLISAKALRKNLAEVRKQGYAICADELDPDVLSFACPIELRGIGVLYSVGIVGLSRRLIYYDRDEIILALRDAADTITLRLQGELKLIDGFNLQV